MTIGGLTVDGQGFDLFMIADARDTPNGQVPEPSGLLLAAVALLGLARVSRRRI
jgi:MYXO-CTERM domain-containing protein